MLRRIQRKSFLSQFDRSHNVLAVLSPNYEERGVVSTYRFCKLVAFLKDAGFAQQVRCVLLTLHGEHPKEMLDVLRANNVERAKEILNAFKVPYQPVVLDYPHLNSKQLEEAIKREVSALSPVTSVWLDVSCLPRTAIYLMLGMFIPEELPPAEMIRGTEIGSVYVLYTWADRYPHSPGPELTGDIIGALTRKSFRQLMNDGRNVGLAISIGGSGHDSALVYSQAREFSHELDIQGELTALITKHDLLTSWSKVSSHYNLLRSAEAAGDRMRYAFSVTDASHHMSNFAHARASSDVGVGSGFLGIAPFGPKPMGVAGYLASRTYRLRVEELSRTPKKLGPFISDVLYTGTDQYTSVYSIGARHTDIFLADSGQFANELNLRQVTQE